MYSRKIIFYFLVLFLSISCKSKDEKAALVSTVYEYKFDINNPSKIYKLPKELKEISGLSFDNTGHLLAVNDEEAIIFKIDTIKGEIVGETDFGKDDDYEGITYGDGLIYVIESNGNIKVIEDESAEKIKEYDTELSEKNNIEGIFYENKRLLIASKSESKKGLIRIFQFDCEQQKMMDSVKFEIDLVKDAESLRLYNMVKHFTVDLDKHRLEEFGPSGIAIDPLTGEHYILSSRGKLLIILNDKGKILVIKFLSKKVFGQPEGIVFDTFGNLYISNEAESGKANILKFNRITN